MQEPGTRQDRCFSPCLGRQQKRMRPPYIMGIRKDESHLSAYTRVLQLVLTEDVSSVSAPGCSPQQPQSHSSTALQDAQQSRAVPLTAAIPGQQEGTRPARLGEASRP